MLNCSLDKLGCSYCLPVSILLSTNSTLKFGSSSYDSISPPAAPSLSLQLLDSFRYWSLLVWWLAEILCCISSPSGTCFDPLLSSSWSSLSLSKLSCSPFEEESKATEEFWNRRFEAASQLKEISECSSNLYLFWSFYETLVILASSLVLWLRLRDLIFLLVVLDLDD